MKEMILTFVVLVATLFGTAVCDYSCLCNYNVELGVLGEDHSSTIGYLYEFDCKPVIQDQTTSNYTAIAYEHKVGYVQTNNEIQLQMCPGDPSVDDIVTTQLPTTTPLPTTIQPTTMQPTTMQRTTTETPTTMQPTTQTPTTIQPTTMQPTTQKPTTLQPTTIQPTTIQQTTMQPTTMQLTTIQPTTMQPTTTKPTTTKPTTIQPTTMKPTTIKPTTMQPTTTEKPTTMQPKTTERPTTMIPITMQPTTKMTTKPVTTSMPSTTLSPITLAHNEECPQIVQEYARDNNNIIATRGKTCYEVEVHRRGTWYQAESDCKSRGGHLLNIASAEEQNFINNLLSKHSFKYNIWIGLNDQNHEEHFEWASGNNITFMNWIPGRKSLFFHGSEDCVYMSPSNNWQWDDDVCSGILETDHRFMCQYRTVDPSTFVITTPSPSPDGNTKLCSTHNMNHAKQFGGSLAQYGHSCYEVLPRNKYSWSHGESICHSHGGHLAHISSAAEQTFIEGFLTRHNPQHAVWIGLHDLGREGHFEWTSGNPVTYTNWMPGHMDNFASHNQEDCVAFIPYQNGKWDDLPCGDQGFFGGDIGVTYPILCQYNTVSNAIVG